MKNIPDNELIEMLKSLLDKGYVLFEEFQDSMKAVTIEEFEDFNRLDTLNERCKYVLMYCGGFYIQVVENNRFIVTINNEEFTGESLHNAERFLWIMYAEKKIKK